MMSLKLPKSKYQNEPIHYLFLGHGGGWGYSGHSIEAVRFMPDTDILLGGFGLFGGRGEYFGKIKVSHYNIVYIIRLILWQYQSSF